MIACIDVGYDEAINRDRAACVTFYDWADQEPAAEVVMDIRNVQPYQPGKFYRRELPCLLSVIQRLPNPLDCILIDGYVWLDERQRKGLGGYLYESLQEKTPVIGVAKSRFVTATSAIEVYRGTSDRPLYVSSAGIDAQEAANIIRGMHGEHRLPTLLKLVDQLSRTTDEGT